MGAVLEGVGAYSFHGIFFKKNVSGRKIALEVSAPSKSIKVQANITYIAF